jgi:hypothetical protein
MNEWICLSMIWMREPLTLLLACLLAWDMMPRDTILQ